MTAEREGLAEIVGVLAEHQIVRDDFSPHCSCGLFRDKRDHDQANYRAHLADALADLLAARDRRVWAEAVREAAQWVAGFGYPVEVRMPENPPPAALWDALVDVIHEDDDGGWHGGELTRDEVDSWLREEADA